MWENKVQFCPLSDWGSEPRSSTLQERTTVPEHIQVFLSVFVSITATIAYEKGKTARKTESNPSQNNMEWCWFKRLQTKRETNLCSHISQKKHSDAKWFHILFLLYMSLLIFFYPMSPNLFQLPICKMIIQLYSHISGYWYLWSTQTPLCWKTVAIIIISF